MIILDLVCTEEHRFEGWFASADAFELQNTEHTICCPICGTNTIKRLPSAPHLARSSNTGTPASSAKTSAHHLASEIKKIAENSEDVGDRFPEEARRIHYGDAEERAIRGTASLSEARSLIDEGISVLPVPKEKKEDLH